jgi:hypothetical protein
MRTQQELIGLVKHSELSMEIKHVLMARLLQRIPTQTRISAPSSDMHTALKYKAKLSLTETELSSLSPYHQAVFAELMEQFRQ